MKSKDILKAFEAAKRKNKERARTNIDEVMDFLEKNVSPAEFAQFVNDLFSIFEGMEDHYKLEELPEVQTICLSIIMLMLEHRDTINRLMKCPEFCVEFV